MVLCAIFVSLKDAALALSPPSQPAKWAMNGPLCRHAALPVACHRGGGTLGLGVAPPKVRPPSRAATWASAGYPWRGSFLLQPTRTCSTNDGDQPVSRSNTLYLIVGLLVVVVAVMGYQLYQDRKKPEGMRIDVGPNGLTIEKK